MKKRILLLEYESEEMDSYVKLLKHKGFQVCAVDTDEEALRILDTNPQDCDLFLSAVGLNTSDCDAIKFVEKVREKHAIRIIMMSYFYNAATRHLYNNGKIQDFIEKPFKYDEFISKIKEILSKS